VKVRDLLEKYYRNLIEFYVDFNKKLIKESNDEGKNYLFDYIF